jgi:hypothetical protein
MPPEVASKLAKLLRLATNSGATDGEALAALGRLSAIAIAQNLDWDRIIINGSGGPELTEEQLTRVYTEGFNRGLAEGQQQAAAQAPSEPNNRTALGAEAQRVERILAAAKIAEQRGILGSLGRVDLADFCESLRDRIHTWGSRTYISDKQRAVLDRLEERLRRQALID